MFIIKFPVKLIPWQVLLIMFFLICMCCSYSQASAEEHRGDLLVSKMISLNPPDGIVHKRTFSDQSRILFVAGLEGTGHHGVQAMIKVCVKTSEKLCEAIEDVTHVFQEARGKSDTIFGLFGVEETGYNAVHIMAAYLKMKDYAVKNERKLYIISLELIKDSGMMSYPNYGGPNKSLNHPDIAVMAALAEMAGMDFRVLVLQRNARDILRSVTSSSYGGAAEPKILVDNAAALYSQMEQLDPRFYFCLPYEKMGNMTDSEQSGFVHFLHPTILPSMMDTMLQMVHYKPKPSTTSTEHFASEEERRFKGASREYHEWLLARQLGLINGLCQKTGHMR